MVVELALDTSVIVEYIVARSPYRRRVVELFREAGRGRVKLYVSTVTLSETLYIASRIYRAGGVENPNEEAANLVEWVKSRAETVPVDEDIAIRAGELKKELRIALPDCYVLATALKVGARPLFRRLEAEMEPVAEKLEKLGTLFLDSLAL